MSRIVMFKMAKGLTVEGSGTIGQWTKKSLALIVQMPDTHTDEDVISAFNHAEYLIDSYLGTPETTAPHIPNFNPEDLMKHAGWKAKKKDDGSYAEGSLSWGWDFTDKFSKETIQALEKGPVEIDKYVFSLNETRTLVSVKKKGEKQK